MSFLSLRRRAPYWQTHFPVPGGGGGGDAAQTTAFLARVVANGTTLDATHIAAYKALINGLVSDGVFAKLDCLYMLATQDLPTAKLNLVQNAFNLTAGTGSTFSADRGITDPGTTQFFDTGFVPSTAGGLYTADAACAMYWANTLAPRPSEFGYANGVGSNLWMGGDGIGNTFMAVNCGIPATISAVPTGTGFYLASRTSPTNRDGYWAARNAVSLTSLGNAQSGFSGGVLPGGSIHIGDVPGQNFSGKEISMVGFGGTLTSGDAASCQSRVQAFMTAVGNV